MQLGMIGLGRMGANMVRRLMRAGHECVVYDHSPQAVTGLALEGATGAANLDEFISKLTSPRAIWLMIPTAFVDSVLNDLVGHLSPGDIVIDGGNSYYVDDLARAARIAPQGIEYVDVGTSGGVWGLERGYCMMIGGSDKAVEYLDPIFKALAPGRGDVPRTEGREKAPPSTAEDGYLHCGGNGGGHFVKMVHNGIEYGLMAAYAEGLNILKHAGAGKIQRAANAETTPLRDPELYQYDFNITDVAEVWRRGSVVSSWLLDLSAHALLQDPTLNAFQGRVSDSGEGRWTVMAAIETGTPAPVLSSALFARFDSRGEDEFADRMLSALRYEFGGHREQGTSVG